MTIQKINLGSSPNGEGGDKWREGSNKINANFDDLDERTTLAQETANSKTANASDAHLLSRSNHTDTQPISTISGLQAALDSAASQINIAGNAATATKLATARTIGGVGFDGSANINLPGVNATGNQNTTGNAATATKLATARTIGGVGFDGTKDIDLPVATTSTAGIAKLVNDLTTGGTDKALTAEMGKFLFDAFSNSKSTYGYQKLPNGLIFQWCEISLPAFTGSGGNSVTNFTFPVSFPNGPLFSGSFIKSAGKNSNWGDVATWVTSESNSSASVVMASKTLVDLSGLPSVKVLLIGH